MSAGVKCTLSAKEKARLIQALKEHLQSLRAQADVSQGTLSDLIGVSRQTYGAIERGSRPMTWNTYLSLILFFDYNQRTHDQLRMSEAFPTMLLDAFNPGAKEQGDADVFSMFRFGTKSMAAKLDERALQTIRTVILLEYARCTATPGDAVVKMFNGISFAAPIESTPEAEKALKTLRRRGRPRKN